MQNSYRLPTWRFQRLFARVAPRAATTNRDAAARLAAAVATEARVPNDWCPIETAPEGIMVMTRIDDAEDGVRNEQLLRRQGRLWYTGTGKQCEACGHTDEGMYVYYRPTHWRPLA